MVGADFTPCREAAAIVESRADASLHRFDDFFILDEVTDLLLRNPQIKQLRVEGHTDDVGGAERNQQLSEDRALAVAKYLSEHGVEANRLQSQGYGLSKPIASNKSEAGRAKNRRVQFRIVQ